MKFLRSWKFRILLFFAVVGPGFITANVYNDANGILTYSQGGAQFGYLLLWTMIPTTMPAWWLVRSDSLTPPMHPEFRETRRAAAAQGVQVQSIQVRRPGDFEAAFKAALAEHA